MCAEQGREISFSGRAKGRKQYRNIPDDCRMKRCFLFAILILKSETTWNDRSIRARQSHIKADGAINSL